MDDPINVGMVAPPSDPNAWLPVEDETDWEAVAEIHLKRWSACEGELIAAQHERDALSEDLRSVKRNRDQWQERALAAEALLRVEEPGPHDYNGSIADGKTVRDPVHERFHGAIGDVLSGKVMPAARRQMQEALKQAPKDEPTTASTSRPMPRGAVASDQQSIGLRLP